MYKLTPDKEINCKKIKIPRENGKSIPALVLSPKTPQKFNEQFEYAMKHYFAENESYGDEEESGGKYT